MLRVQIQINEFEMISNFQDRKRIIFYHMPLHVKFQDTHIVLKYKQLDTEDRFAKQLVSSI